MTHPVVSSRFGKRPILEIPPMCVNAPGQMEVGSIQGSYHPQYYTDMFPGVTNPMLGPGFSTSAPPMVPPVTNWPHPGYEVPGRFATAPAYYPGVFDPNGIVGYPRPIPRVVRDPSFGPMNPGFSVTCDLEYGRIVNINVRESQGEFRGIPPFLRDELVRTYGRYPYTEVRVRLEGGEFHIYATHKKPRYRRRRPRSEDDRYSDNEYDSDSVDGIRLPVRDPDGTRISYEDGWGHYR